MARMSNAYMAEYLLKRYYRRKAIAIAQLGGHCSMCDGTDDLEFHHRNRAEKSFAIGHLLATVSEAKLQAELVKCDLLCGQCHRDSHRRFAACALTGLSLRRCRCDNCRAEAKTHARNQRNLKWLAVWWARHNARKAAHVRP